MIKIKSRKIRLRKDCLVRTVLCILIIVLGSYFSSYVNAGEYDSVIEKNRVDNVYAITNIDGRDRIFYLNMYEMNGRVSYCIDLGVDINTSIYHSTNDFSISYLTDEQIDYIRKISYFGYGYDKHNDYKYYMAAQELIWEYLSNVNIKWTSEMNVNASKIDIESYKNDILNLIYNNEFLLDLDWNDGQVYSVGEEIVILDNNNVLNNYEVVSSKYSDVFIEDNKLIIRIGNNIGKEVIELKKKGYYEYDSSLYYYDNSQRLISDGNYMDVEKTIEFDIKGVSFQGKVVDSVTITNKPRGEGSLKGAVYELYDVSDNLIGTYESNNKGLFNVDNLLLGKYYFVQVKASDGYIVNKSRINFEITEDKMEVLIRQRVMSNNIEIRKLYGENGEYRPEAGIQFKVYTRSGRTYIILTTNNDGVTKITLPYGWYKIEQLNSTSGYAKVEDFIVEVKEHNEEIIHYNLVDELIKAKVRVNTYEQKSGELLNIGEISYKIKKKGDDDYLEYDGNDIFSMNNSEGNLMPISLEYGDYILEQVDVPDGVLLNDEKIEFSINDTSNLNLVNGNLVFDINVYNQLVMGQVEVNAKEEVFYKALNDYGYNMVQRDNVEFSLIAKEDIVVNGNILYKASQEIDNGLTDVNGNLIFDNLYLGNYCLIDKITEEEKCFILGDEDNKISVVEEKIEFINKLNKVDVIIENLSNNGEVIKNSMFELLDQDDLIIYKGITNEDGIIKIEDLISGNYCIRQIKISSKYKMNDNNECFFLDTDKEIKFINDEVRKEIVSVPNTFMEDMGIYETMVFICLIGIGILVYKKIFNSKLYR